MVDPSRSIPSICQELGHLRPSTLYPHADRVMKTPERELLGEKLWRDEAAQVAPRPATGRA